MGILGQIWGGITGQTQADAAVEAAQIQANAANQAAQATAQATQDQIAAQQAAAAQQRADLQPYSQFGQGFMGQANQAVGNVQGLMNDPMSIMQNPMFAAIQDDVRRQNLQNAAVGGRLGTGGTMAGLESSALRTGFDILNNERSAQMQNVGMLQGLVGMGQNAATNQGMGALQTGQGVSNAIGSGNLAQQDFLTSGAAANAAGVMGEANALSQGASNLLGLGTSLATSGLGGAIGGAIGGMIPGAGDIFSSLGMPSIGTALNPTQVMTRPGQTYGR